MQKHYLFYVSEREKVAMRIILTDLTDLAEIFPTKLSSSIASWWYSDFAGPD
jgi:hypothetical protein